MGDSCCYMGGRSSRRRNYHLFYATYPRRPYAFHKGESMEPMLYGSFRRSDPGLLAHRMSLFFQAADARPFAGCSYQNPIPDSTPDSIPNSDPVHRFPPLRDMDRKYKEWYLRDANNHQHAGSLPGWCHLRDIRSQPAVFRNFHPGWRNRWRL